MKRLPFNTITILWGIVILLASCAFTIKTQKAQPVQQKQKKTPTPRFLGKLKSTKTVLIGGGEYYDFRKFDFENYEKPNFENLFTTYADLFGLNKHDEMKPTHPIKFRNSKKKLYSYDYNQEVFSETKFQHFHKGFPVFTKSGETYQLTAYGDSTGKYLWRVMGKNVMNLDVDTATTLSNKDAFKIAIATVPVNKEKGEYFPWEAWSEIEYIEGHHPEHIKSWFKEPVGNEVILDDKKAYLFVIPKQQTIFVNYIVFVDAMSGELLFSRKPHINYLAAPIETNKSIKRLK